MNIKFGFGTLLLHRIKRSALLLSHKPYSQLHTYICDTDNILTSYSTRDDFRLNRFVQSTRMVNVRINNLWNIYIGIGRPD